VRKRKVLLLNANYTPHNLISWKHAVCLIVRDKATVVEEYPDWEVRSPSTSMKVPSVVVLNDYVSYRRELNYSRENVLRRDGYMCQYCERSVWDDSELDKSDLTIDHVRPLSQDGDTRWTNVVACCERCNLKKGDRTPSEADMDLKRDPDTPRGQNPVKFRIKGRPIEDSWKPYCTWLED
jgi:5-methylcytosine-specific restriction endonuclease McrA